jgi:hypothetical protein
VHQPGQLVVGAGGGELGQHLADPGEVAVLLGEQR